MLTTFVVLRRYFNSAVAAFAAVLPGLLEPGLAAVLARPYTIMTACFLLNAALWLDMDSQRHPWWCAAGMAGLFALAVSVHFNSVFFVVPFAGMELARTLRTRKWRWPCWIAFCAGGSSIFLFWPVISATYQTTLAATASRGFYARPSVASLVQALGSLIINRQASLLLWMFLWICAIYFVIYSNSPNSGVADELPSKPSRYGDDLNLSALGSLLFPVVMLLVGIWGTHVFNGRYTYPFIFGLSVLIARITSYLPYASRLCTLMVWMVGMLLWLMVPGGSKPDARLEAISSAHENLPILASEASDFFELQESAPKPLKQRLFYSQMPAGVPNNDFDPERIAIAWQKFRPMQVVRAEDFFARWPRFYLLYPSTDRERMGSWILEHAKATVVSHSGIQYLFEISDLHQ